MADLPCPTCGSTLTFIDQYQRYYCHRCLAYAPEGYGEHGAQPCPTCGGILSYVRQYGRMYCYKCNAYVPDQPLAEPSVETASAPPPQPAPTQAAATPPSPAPSTAAPENEPASAGSALVAALATPTTEAPSKPAQEAKAESEEPERESAQEGAAPSESVPLAEPVPKAEAAPQPPPSIEMRILAAAKPAAIRVKLFSLKKPELIDLCRVYNLDTSGTKEDIQQRLLSYLHDIELDGEAKEGAEAVRETPSTVTASDVPEQPAVPRPAESEETPAASGPVQYAAAAVAEEIHPEPVPAPAPVVITPGPVAAEVPHVTAKAEHPCPTCGRSLTYISQYNRWYCYYCQRYAPSVARTRNACPTCGATMRWIDQHHRWWCDACQKYASPDFPPPAGVVQTAAAATAEPVVASAGLRAIVVHRHGSPAGGAGLVGFGIALYFVYAFFAYLGAMMGIVTPSGITPEVLSLLQFFAFLFVALGAIAGLYGMRDRA